MDGDYVCEVCHHLTLEPSHIQALWWARSKISWVLFVGGIYAT